MSIERIIRELGHEPTDSETENFELVRNEIIILRDKLKQAEDEALRAERRLGKEMELRTISERKVRHAVGLLETIRRKIRDAERKALADGAPLFLERRSDLEPQIARVGEGGDYPVAGT